MCWSSKLLAENPGWQGRLRKALHAAFPTAKTENRCPTAREIMETSIPFLDATIEETLRYRPTAPLGTRDAIRDTTILGHPVPKGTTVIWLVNSSNFLKPAMEVDESRRSQRCQEEKKQQSGRVGEWEDNDIGLFKPERWLTTDKEGSTVFDGNAGPSSPFGMGLRSCFGRRLAHVEMKIILAMLFWSFELLECPAELSGHSGHLALTYKPAQCYVRLKKVDHANV